MKTENPWPQSILWDKKSLLLSISIPPRFYQYSKLQNMGNWESIGKSTIVYSFCKGHCVVQVSPAFIVDSFIFWGNSLSDLVTYITSGIRYEYILYNQLIPALQQREGVNSTFFMPDGAFSHFATSVNQLLNLYFGNIKITYRHFWTFTLNIRYFCLWGNLKLVL